MSGIPGTSLGKGQGQDPAEKRSFHGAGVWGIAHWRWCLWQTMDGGGCIYWLAASGQLCCQQTMLTWTPKEKHASGDESRSCHGSVAQGTVRRPFPREGEPAPQPPHGLPSSPFLLGGMTTAAG